MKRLLRYGHVLVAAGAVAMGALIGCGGGTEPGGIPLNRSQFVGTWRESTIGTANVASSGCPGTIIFGNNLTASCGGSIVFRSDLTYTFFHAATGQETVVENGVWDLVRNELSMRDDVTGQVTKLYMLMAEDGNSVIGSRMIGNFKVDWTWVRTP